jgi:hypothetical protein
MIVCDICYDGRGDVACFGECSLKICLVCFNQLLKINLAGDIEYSCPQCRCISRKNLDVNFTDFVNGNHNTLLKMISLLEDTVETNQVALLGLQWINWNDASLNPVHSAIQINHL